MKKLILIGITIISAMAFADTNTKKILEKNKEITAIFICNNEMTLGALQAIREKNLKIPDDIAIVSYDNHKYFEILGINISAIKIIG